MSRPRLTVLVVDHDPATVRALSAGLAELQVRVHSANSGAAALQLASRAHPDLLLIDADLPDMPGLRLLERLRANGPRCRAIVMAAAPTPSGAVEALRGGADDYMGKPLDLGRLRSAIDSCVDDVSIPRAAASDAGKPAQEWCGIVGSSTPLRALVGAVLRLAPYIRTALIWGETGVGKELVARAIHRSGVRGRGKFVAVNCAAVTSELFESLMFGHVRGAFTDARDTRTGLFEAADRGVLFLDEVGELTTGAQAKLLRVLETGEVQRVGGLEPVRVDVQVLAATNRDLRHEVAAGRFRRDLFYRLTVVDLRVPPLRERRDDIAPLTRHFLRESVARCEKSIQGVTSEGMALLRGAPWDGNVRELRNVIERAVLYATGSQLTEDDLREGGFSEVPIAPVPVDLGIAATRAEPTPGAEPPPLLATLEREHIERVLRRVKSKTEAAKLLGISRGRLNRRIKEFGLNAPGETRLRHARPPESSSDDLAETLTNAMSPHIVRHLSKGVRKPSPGPIAVPSHAPDIAVPQWHGPMPPSLAESTRMVCAAVMHRFTAAADDLRREMRRSEMLRGVSRELVRAAQQARA